MSLRKKCITAVNKTFEKRRQQNAAEETRRKEEVLAKIPQMAALEQEMEANMSAFMTFAFEENEKGNEKKFRAY